MASSFTPVIGDAATNKVDAWKPLKSRVDPFWNPVRLSGRVKFRKSSSKKTIQYWNGGISKKQLFDVDTDIKIEDEEEKRGGCQDQFHKYCQHTSLHGFRYVTEAKRNITERIFWICWCIFGISSAMYMMSKIWQKWQDNPVLTSIATTNLPVSEINFPAVTICTVNKAITEKLIIQACRFNTTLSTIRKIISGLVDPESRNNDNDEKISDTVNSTTAMKYLRLVAPKCEDYLLRCELNGLKRSCIDLFKLVLTDSGYCCTFNSMDANSIIVADTKNDSELLKEESEFVYLQKAVWQWHDDHANDNKDKENGNGHHPEMESNNTKLPTDSLTCNRTYDDSMFPRICRHLKRCRDNPLSCHLNVSAWTNAKPTDPPESVGSDSSTSIPGKNGSFYKATGSGRSRGLTLMIDSLRCGDIPTDSFKGLRVYVHGADEFPAVSEKGFIVGPGLETQVGVSSIDAYSADALMLFKPKNRECYFGTEFKLDYYKEYSRSSCVVECETKFIYQECKCVPYYSPAAGNYTICNMKKMLECVQKAIDAIQKRKVSESPRENPEQKQGSERPKFNFKTLGSQDQENTCIDFCLPGCNETFYNIVVSTATFPNQNEPNKTKVLREAIADGIANLADINYVSGSISLLRIFFRESTIMQYKRDELFTWEDFVSNLGGVMSLCLGFSLLSLIEVIYFFTIRQINDRRRHNKEKRNNLSNITMISSY